MSPPRRRIVGGLDLGGTKIQAVILDGRRNVVAQARRPTPRDGGPPAVVEALAGALSDACAEGGVETRDLTGVGVGSPGAIDARRGVVTGARNLPGEGAPIRMTAGLRELTGTRAYVENDVTVGVWAEYALGAAQRSKALLGVWWGTGVGGGIVLGGKTWQGRGAAAELGHVVVKVDGARCTCGRRGCLEAYAGRGAMEIRARQLHRRGHETDLFKALGAGVGSAVNLLDVETVVIGGGLGTRLGEPYVERIREAMMPHIFADHRPPAVRLAALGDLGGAIGAALLVPRTAAARTT
jgi:glucokinase